MNSRDTHIKVPEYILLETIEVLLKDIQLNIQANLTTPTASWLYRVFKNVGIPRYESFQQAIEVFNRATDHPRKIVVDLMWNMKRNGAPSIHITLPAEAPSPQGNGMGMDEGYADLEVTSTTQLPSAGQYPITRRYSATYGITIVSDNSNEVVLIYNVLKAGLLARSASINLRGLENFSVGGQDVQLNSQNTPPNLYVRTLTFRFDYEFSSLPLTSNFIPQDIDLEGTPTGIAEDALDTPDNTNDI